jgi:hypothetical protein
MVNWILQNFKTGRLVRNWFQEMLEIRPGSTHCSSALDEVFDFAATDYEISVLVKHRARQAEYLFGI